MLQVLNGRSHGMEISADKLEETPSDINIVVSQNPNPPWESVGPIKLDSGDCFAYPCRLVTACGGVEGLEADATTTRHRPEINPQYINKIFENLDLRV